MSKKSKILTSFVCAAMLFSSTAALPVNAENSRGMAYSCPECLVGAVYNSTTRVYEHDEILPCAHKGSGYKDVYAVYEVTVNSSCKNCSYRDTYKYVDHVYKYCFKSK